MKAQNGIEGSFSDENEYTDFLVHFESQSELGLVICKETSDLEIVKNGLLKDRYQLYPPENEYSDLKIAQALCRNEKVLIVLDNDLTKTNNDLPYYNLIVQFSGSPGIIQHVNKETFKAKLYEFDTNVAKLLILVSENNLKQLEKKYPIRDKVGLIFRT